ncbi:hypothetical protein FSP39_018110 [Pinctada imbricata]|uniref:Non-structural maintenance of chromosomes element 1 homolog n=1 Tax=Pinctada imbricata TaxID=66713 RepID=A0AA89C1V3_PINIB|nr:hypothetical protein FSP39_018110 [Pinctada imbricata]
MMKDCHKLFLQSFMSRGILEAKEVKQLFRTVCLKYQENLPESEEERLRLLPAFVRTINDNVKPFHMEIKKGISEEDGISYYCLVNTTQSSYCKFSSDYSANELEFYKKLIEVIVNSEDGQVSSTDALNLTSTLKEKKMSKDAAQQLLKRLENDKWIKMSRGKICLATRSLLEMEMYILDTYKDDVDKCETCNKLCIKGDSCPSCGTKLHYHCARRFFHGRDSPVCPKKGCGEPWPYSYDADMLGTGDSSPASVFISGDPSIDQILGLKVTTPTNIYNVKLQRVNHKLFHEDVRYLSVSTDRNGKTVFTEEYKPEGVMFDELMVAPPKLRHRHKRDLFQNSHTLWKQDNITDEAFHYDVLKVPEFVDKLQINHSKVHKKKRKKRQVRPPRIEPELLLFVDYALYRDFDGDSNELLEYLLHFWHAVNWKYLTVALAGQWPVIDLKIREIGVFKEPNAQPFIESSRLYKGSKLFSLYDAMDSLKEWLIKYENVLPVHDVAFLQSGENACRKGKDREVITPYSPNALTAIMRTMPLSPREAAKDANECVKGTAGVAYVRGACLSAPLLRGNAYNFGIGEASTSFNGVIIAAHEVGHLLGAYHDGEAEASGCSSQSGFIMSYTRDDSFKFSRFSECSVRSFQNFLRMDRSACLMKRSSRETLQFPTTFPGKYMTLKEQCRRFTGGPPCEEGAKQCEHLCCDDRNGEWRYTRSEPAVDGTACSKGNSVCVESVSLQSARGNLTSINILLCFQDIKECTSEDEISLF